MSLVTLQEKAVTEMLAPRSSEKRAAKHRAAVIRHYRARVEALGYTAEQIAAQVQDVRDMWRLRKDCDEE